MLVRKETILSVFPGADDDRRLVVAVEQVDSGPSNLVLRQETHSEDVGWFVQSRVAIEPDQVAGLRMALSGGERPALKPRVRRVDPGGTGTEISPAILRFDGAPASQAG